MSNRELRKRPLPADENNDVGGAASRPAKRAASRARPSVPPQRFVAPVTKAAKQKSFGCDQCSYRYDNVLPKGHRAGYAISMSY